VGSERRRDAGNSAVKEAWLTASVWLLLAAVQGVAARTGWRQEGVTASFAIAALAVLPGRPRARLLGPVVTPATAAAGLLLAPACGGLVVVAGVAFGLERGTAPRAAGSEPALLGTAVLAPLFEEVLYRGRLLPALRARWGAAAAVVVSSAAFALPHLRPWALVGAFAVGLGLGALRVGSGRLAPCVGLHAGLNLGLAGRLHAPGLPWPALLESTCAGAALLCLAVRSGPRSAHTGGHGRGA